MERKRRKSLTEWARERTHWIIDPLAGLLSRLHVHPNTVTILGLMLNIGVGVLFAWGYLRIGGALLFLVAPLDALDGALARLVGQKSDFGAFLDSTFDRFSDAALVLGLTAYAFSRNRPLEIALLLVGLVAALMVSYTRARAEALGFSCKVGLLTRLERIALIILFTVLGLPRVLAWAFALLSAVTVVQRVLYVYAQSRSRR